MNSIFKKLFIVLIITVAYSCKKEITINLNDASPQTIIEGVITNIPGPYQVQITKSVNFSSSNIFPAVTGAIVIITDEENHLIDTLSEGLPGIYKTHAIKGISGHTYDLYVSASGQKFTSTSVMPFPVALDSITFIHNSFFGVNSINSVPNFRDPAGISNYYSFTQTVNRKTIKGTFIFDDRLSDGKYITQQLFLDSAYIKVGDTVSLSMNCIDKNVWNYFNVLEQISQNNGGASVTPANPASNISNNALGYFSAQAVQTKSKIVSK